jgi:hypothetical protein
MKNIKNFNTLPVSPDNSFTFNKNTFDLTILYEELGTFYNCLLFDKDIYYAHVFNRYGLFFNPYPIKGYQAKRINFNSLFFSPFNDKDITLITDIENDAVDNYFNSMYKYNILYLYDSILKTLKDNGYNDFFDKNIEKEVEFYLFISKHCINTPEFDVFKDEFYKKD